MERWYIGFRTRSSPVDLTQNLGRLVRQNGLGDFITRACYERRSVHKRISEYYYFVGVVSDEKGSIPEEKYHALYSIFSQLGVHDSRIYVYYDEIQPMASKEIEAFNFRQI